MVDGKKPSRRDAFSALYHSARSFKGLYSDNLIGSSVFSINSLTVKMHMVPSSIVQMETHRQEQNHDKRNRYRIHSLQKI